MKIEDVNKRISDHEKHCDDRQTAIFDKFQKVDEKIDERSEKLEDRFDKRAGEIEQRFDKRSDKIEQDVKGISKIVFIGIGVIIAFETVLFVIAEAWK